MVSAPFPGRPFSLRENVWVVRQETGNNRSLVHGELWIDKRGTSPTWSADGLAFRELFLDGGSAQRIDGRGYDFRAAGPWLILAVEVWITHNADGGKFCSITGRANYDQLGATEVNSGIDLPRINRYPPPEAPINGRADQLRKTSFRYTWESGGGEAIDFYEVRIADNPQFNNRRQFRANPGDTITGLEPGRKYYAEAVAHNPVGYSQWGAHVETVTLTGALISDGSQWLPAEVLISDGSQWLPAMVSISDGSAWQLTA